MASKEVQVRYVSKHNAITISKKFKDQLDIGTGDALECFVEDDTICYRKIKNKQQIAQHILDKSMNIIQNKIKTSNKYVIDSIINNLSLVLKYDENNE